MEGYKLLKRNVLVKGKITEYCSDSLQLPNGNKVEWDFINHKGASAIVPIDEDGNIIVVRQYRHAIQKYTIEIPAGGINPNEDTKKAALRELEEETGYYADDAEHLIDIFTTVAYCNEKIYIYTATNLKRTQQNLDEDEFVKIEKYSLKDLVNMILDGTIEDSKTISAILAYKNKYEL